MKKCFWQIAFIFILMFYITGCSHGEDKHEKVATYESVSLNETSDVTSPADILSDTTEVREEVPPEPEIDTFWIEPSQRIYDESYLISSLGSDFSLVGNICDNTYSVIYSDDWLVVKTDLSNNRGCLVYSRDSRSAYMKTDYNGEEHLYANSIIRMSDSRCAHKRCENVSCDLELFANISLESEQYSNVTFVETREIDGELYDIISSDLDENYFNAPRMDSTFEEKYTYWYISHKTGRPGYIEIPLYDLYGNEMYVVMNCYPNQSSDIHEYAHDSVQRNLNDNAHEYIFDDIYNDCSVKPYKLYGQRDILIRFAATNISDVGDFDDIIINFGTDNVYLQTIRDYEVINTEEVDDTNISEFVKYYVYEPIYIRELLYESYVKIILKPNNDFAGESSRTIGLYTTDYSGSRSILYDCSEFRHIAKAVNHEIGHCIDEMYYTKYRPDGEKTSDRLHMISHTAAFKQIYETEGRNCGWQLSLDDPAEFFAETYRYVVENNDNELAKVPTAANYIRNVLKDIEIKSQDF